MVNETVARAKWSSDAFADLQRCVFGFWKFSLIQPLPALQELLDDGAFPVDDLEACDVGSPRKHSVQAHVGEALVTESQQSLVQSRRSAEDSRPAAAPRYQRHLSA